MRTLAPCPWQIHFEELNKRGKVDDFRQKAWEKWLKLGMPTKAQDDFASVVFRDLLEAKFEPFSVSTSFSLEECILPECHDSYLTFIDGYYSSAHSSSEIEAVSLEEAAKTHASFLQKEQIHLLGQENDPLALLSLSLHPEGGFLYIPPSFEATRPLQILFLATSDEPQIIAPRFKVVMGKGAKAQLILTCIAKNRSAPHLFLPFIEIAQEELSELRMMQTPPEAPSSWYFQTVRATVKKRALFHHFSLATGMKLQRESFSVQLKGQEAEAILKGVSLLEENHASHIHSVIQHEAFNSHSMQSFKGVLKNNARSSFNGKIIVQPEAQKTEAYQLNKYLLLDSGAMAHSRPQLEIFADDVKASHGATVCQIDPVQLFYLQTRGIAQERACSLLIEAFCQEMFEEIPYPSLIPKIQTGKKT